MDMFDWGCSAQNVYNMGAIPYPSIKILMEIHSTTPYRKATATQRNPCTLWGTR